MTVVYDPAYDRAVKRTLGGKAILAMLVAWGAAFLVASFMSASRLGISFEAAASKVFAMFIAPFAALIDWSVPLWSMGALMLVAVEVVVLALTSRQTSFGLAFIAQLLMAVVWLACVGYATGAGLFVLGVPMAQ